MVAVKSGVQSMNCSNMTLPMHPLEILHTIIVEFALNHSIAKFGSQLLDKQ